MIGLNEYVKMVLKKKKWTNVRFVEEINKIEVKLGEKRTVKQNVTNALNGEYNLSPKTIVKYECALGLPFGSLLNLSKEPITKNGKKELEKFIEKVRN